VVWERGVEMERGEWGRRRRGERRWIEGEEDGGGERRCGEIKRIRKERRKRKKERR
jgi:hypothetical protein